jgi:glycosyltransferase involved in cell wall biosynthesis
MPRLAYICLDPGVPPFGDKGCSVHVQEVLRVFTQFGWQVQLYCCKTGGAAPEGLEAVIAREFPVAKFALTAEREQALLALNSELLDVLAAEEPFNLLYERHALWSFAAADYAERTRTPLLLEVNAPLMVEQAHHRELIDRVGAARATRRMMEGASLVAAVSPEVAAYCTTHGAALDRAVVSPNGVCCERFTPRSPTRAIDEPFTIGFVGSFRPWHAVNDLVTAFAQLHATTEKVRLTIVGRGPGREAIVEQVAQLPLATRTAIELVGHVPPADVPQWLAKFDVAIAPYAADDECYFSPLKIYEYLASGLPVVAARSGSLPEVIRHGHNGMLYSPGDSSDLALQLQRLAGDPARGKSLGAAARRDALELHSWRGRIEALLERLEMSEGIPAVDTNETELMSFELREPMLPGSLRAVSR